MAKTIQIDSRQLLGLRLLKARGTPSNNARSSVSAKVGMKPTQPETSHARLGAKIGMKPTLRDTVAR